MRAWGPITNPTARALASWLCALWGRLEGTRGGRLSSGPGASEVGRSPTPDRLSFGACGRGPLPTGCGCGGCGRGDPSPSCELAWRAVGAARGARGGASCLGVGRPWSGALPTPTTRPLGRAAEARYPLAVVAGGVGVGARHHPHSARSCELPLRAVGAARGRPGGGRLLPACGAFGVGRSRTPDCRSFGACGRGPLPTGCGCGGRGRGAPSPTPQRALLRAGFARCGGGMTAPGGGGASCLGAGRPGSGALPPPTARPLGRATGAHHPLAAGAGDAGVGTRHQPHSVRSCELALRAVGAAQGHPGGAPLAWPWGVRGRALSHPRPPILWGVRPGPATHWLRVRGLRAWGPVTKPTARALASWLCAPWGLLEGTRGGRLLPGFGAPGVGRSSSPDRPSFGACGRGPLPTGCGCGGCGRGDPSPTPQRALLRAAFARCGGGSRAPGGGASCLAVGRPGSGALPGGDWGANAARARAHAHAKDTRGGPEGQPDRARGTHRPHGMAYQRARLRDTRTGRPATHSAENAGREGGNGEDTKPGTGLNPPDPAASAAHTRPGHCTRQGSSGAPRHAPAPRLRSLRAGPRGSHWRQASSTGPAAPAPRATTH